MLQWKNASISLGERCVAFCENEMKSGVKEDYPASYTSTRIAQYFSVCTRLIQGEEVPIGIQLGNWCSCSQSFALHESILPGETKPHGFRVGVVELVSDLKTNNLYRDAASVRQGKYQIKRGDLVIWDRSNPSKPETAWWRHVSRITEVNDSTFTCISGNSGGKFSISHHQLSQPNLLGFGEYPALTQTIMNDGVGFVEDWSSVPMDQLNPSMDSGDIPRIDLLDVAHKILAG
jgi:hypothetical protein